MVGNGRASQSRGTGPAGGRAAPQSRVAFLDKNGPEYFEVLLGGGKANVVNVAVNWRLTPAEMAYVINDAGARLLVVGRDFAGHLEAMEPTKRQPKVAMRRPRDRLTGALTRFCCCSPSSC